MAIRCDALASVCSLTVAQDWPVIWRSMSRNTMPGEPIAMPGAARSGSISHERLIGVEDRVFRGIGAQAEAFGGDRRQAIECAQPGGPPARGVPLR